MIEIELFQATVDLRNPEEEPENLWLAREIKRVDSMGWMQPTVAEMQAFLKESEFTYEFVQHRQRKYLVRDPRQPPIPIIDVTVSIRFPDDTEGLYFKMWRS